MENKPEFNFLNFFSVWGYLWFLLYYFKFIDLNPSILYMFLIVPIFYLVSNVILHMKNDSNKTLILICFFISDIFPIVYLIYKNDIVLEFKSFLLAIFLLFIYLLNLKKNNIDIDNLYSYYIFQKRLIN